MAKIFTFLVFFFTILFGAYENELASFDKNFIGSKNEVQIKFHHQLKSLYIQSVINEDEKTKIEILKRLIISSNTLNLDDKSYANELKESGISEASINALRKAVVRDVKIENTPKSVEKPTFTSQNSSQQIEKKIENTTKISPVQIKQEEKKPSVSSNDMKLYILNSKINAGNLELFLNIDIAKNKIKTFSLDAQDNFRYIIDFEGILEGGKKEYKLNHYRIVVSQYNPSSVRVVIYSKVKIPIEVDTLDKMMRVIVEKQNNDSKKSQAILTQKKEEQKNIQKNIPKKQESKEVIKKAEPKQEIKSDKIEKKEKIYILDVDKISNGVVLNLSDAIGEKDISVLVSKEQKVFRYILSFEAVLEGGRKTFSYGKNVITVTQYNPKIVRVVLSAPKEFDFYKDFDDKSLKLGFESFNQNVRVNNSNKKNLNNSYKSGKLIVIDAGHGGKDSGALSDKKGSLKEKDIVLSAALKLGNELKKRGYKVLYTRNTDKFINLRDRTKYANDKRADLFISIHANAAPNATKAKSSEGVETFFLSPARSERSKKAAEKENQGDFEEINYFSKQSILNFLNREKIVASNKLAIDVQKNILTQTRKKYKIVDGGVREAPFWVLVGAQMPAILVEIGYITHPTEGKRIANKTFQDLLVKGIADGVENYFYNNR